MAKKNNGIFIAIAIVIAAIIIAPNLNFSVFSTVNQATQDQLNNQESGSCYVTINPSVVTVGDLVTGTIHDGANTLCTVYASDGTVWKNIGSGTTDSNGVFSLTQAIEIVGTFTFRAICGSCITSQVTLQVNDLPPDDSIPCVDSDGDDRYTPGHVTYETQYYDQCLDVGEAVTEYLCVDGMVSSKNWACDYGEVCVQTRSGGYCEKPFYECTDSDGLDFMVFGNCQDSYHMAGFPDECAGTWAVTEYFCDTNNICQSQVMACPAPLMCIGGACVNIP